LQVPSKVQGEIAGQICVIFNVFLHEKYKVERFLESIRRLTEVELFDYRILLRGPQSSFAKEQLISQIPIKNLTNVHLELKEESKDWKLNTLLMVRESNYRYYLLAQEDHLLVASLELSSHFFSECLRLDIDVAPISFFETNQNLREYFTNMNARISEICISCTLEKGWDSDLTARVWLNSLVSLYKRDLLIKLLSTPRPIIKKFPPFTPFDFEQQPGSTWFLPISFALPTAEIFACIDDGPSGSSLQERGLYSLDSARVPIHNVAGTASEKGSLVKVLELFLVRISKVLGSPSSGKSLRLVVSLKFRLKMLTRLRYSTIWWYYIIKNRNISLRDFKLRI
jgi:hypothetical protein